ncbi:SAM-dependent methyltransferase [uncultured Methylobacterium sp.]|uniref:SAM-dependent methyltransferase n=1 Tax=uncultured Methylobacterium sp. TaxID=157278 RepID=UPI0035CAA1CB
MNRPQTSLPPDYFVGLYGEDSDPWGFATSAYESGKYAATLASLPRARYASALEVGCSAGVLSRSLALRCDALIGLDVVPVALDAARARCADQPWVRFEACAIPDSWPDGRFDLILLSELLYFFSRADLLRIAARVASAIEPGGDVVLVHWLGGTDYPLSGEDAADAFIAAAGFARPFHQVRTQDYRIDVLRARAADP